jgi:hypothetical protein
MRASVGGRLEEEFVNRSNTQDCQIMNLDIVLHLFFTVPLAQPTDRLEEGMEI